MNCGRPTSDPKSESIRVRLNDKMKNHLFEKSQREGKTVSQIIRDLIITDMKNERR